MSQPNLITTLNQAKEALSQNDRIKAVELLQQAHTIAALSEQNKAFFDAIVKNSIDLQALITEMIGV